MADRRTPDATLIAALRILARDIKSGDGVANATVAEAAERLEELVEERLWISVGERLPEDNVAVLCWVDGSGAKMAFRKNGKWLLSFVCCEVSDLTYTHWMPLPPGLEEDRNG